MIRVRGNCPWKFQRQLQKGGRVQKEKKNCTGFCEGMCFYDTQGRI